MASKLPYMLAPGLIPRILEKIQQARRPERFTQDFLETKLSHSGGSARPFIPLLKRMGFLASDGSPTTRYDQFRNDETQGVAVAEGMRTAFSELFERNEYVYELSRDKLISLVTEITGSAKGDRISNGVVGTFMALKEFADFEGEALPTENREELLVDQKPPAHIPIDQGRRAAMEAAANVDLKVSYTINLNLPETTDPEVLNAIFRSLKENLLKD
jgi:hypothetical protein